MKNRNAAMLDIGRENFHPPNSSEEGSGADGSPSAPRVFIYVDGFNLYYRLLKNRSDCKWLDLKSLFTSLCRPQDQIVKIKYFTARVSNRPWNPGVATRQDTYFRALKSTTYEIEFIYGQFQSHPVEMWLSDRSAKVEVIKTEEKGSDVNLATHLLNDAWKNLYDIAILVSNDSDMASAIEMAKSLGKTVGWFMTDKKKPSKKLEPLMHFKKMIRPGRMLHHLLPDTIPGTTITKPKEWN